MPGLVYGSVVGCGCCGKGTGRASLGLPWGRQAVLQGRAPRAVTHTHCSWGTGAVC